MSRINAALLSFNRGLLSPKALARVDLDKVRLSAEVFNNFIASTQGSLSIRPGTKWKGSSIRDTGAAWVEFIASTDDVALLELTDEKMRIRLGEDAHDLSLLSRPPVDTTVSLSDTGWTDASTGGAAIGSASDIIPAMTGPTTNGVTVSASSEWGSGGMPAWRAADDIVFFGLGVPSDWQDTGEGSASSLPSWWKVNFGAGNTKAVSSYSIQASFPPGRQDNAPTEWTLQYNDVDTGAGWTTVDTRTGQTGWAPAEKRTFTRPDADTGTVEAFRYWRLNFTAVDGDTELAVSEIELFDAATANQAKFSSGTLILNATSIGARAIAKKRVIVSDTGTEHALVFRIGRGPVTLRVGSTDGDDDYIRETSLGTGDHNLAFTPQGNFWITLQSDEVIDRIVSSLAISDSGTVEIETPWGATNLDDVRFDQSADVVFVDCDGVRQQKIERRGIGRSWSVVDYAPDDGPFLSTRSSSAKLSASHFFGNTTLNSDIPFFTPEHVGALIRAFHNGQSGQWRLGALDAYTDPIAVTGILDTGVSTSDNERNITFSVSGTWAGTITVERSIDGPDIGFKPVPSK